MRFFSILALRVIEWGISAFSLPLFSLQPIGLLARRAKRGEGRFYKS
jgi:hypothetical protein